MSIKSLNTELLESILPLVEKPARYAGNEWNSVIKYVSGGDCASLTRFAFCFPDIYEIGMSHIGLRIIYEAINRRSDAACERAFAPWPDMERLMRGRGIPLFALESRDSLELFDFVGFTLQYELCYTNVLNMLDLAGVPPLAAERGDRLPIVIAGGPCVCNPAPMADFFDIMTPGEGEEVINDILDLYAEMKRAYTGGSACKYDSESVPKRDNCSISINEYAPAFKRDFLREAAKIEGVYVPAFPPAKGQRVKKRIITDLDAACVPERGLVPNIEIIHDRIVLELFRGCIRGCRFCQAGYIYRPVRERDPQVLLRQASALLCSTGYEEISLSSLSTSDYTGLDKLTADLICETSGKNVNLSLPSLRAGSFSTDLAKSAGNVRRSGLTFAPEAGSQRLRDVINKGIAEEDLLESAALAFDAGWGAIKLYFMIGLPTETTEDLEAIVELVRKTAGLYMKTPKDRRARDLSINVSVASFVPKPFTPFQWEAQDDIGTLTEKQEFLKKALKMRYVKLNWNDARESFLEAALARGGAETGAVIYEAWKAGARLDGWGEHFRFDAWMAAYAKMGVDPAYRANRQIKLDEPLPWDIMDYGITNEFLLREREKAYGGILTANCRESCSSCGIDRSYGCALRGD